MEPQRYRFGSGTRPEASSSAIRAGPSRSNGDDRKVNDLLGKLRLEQGRHRRNVLDRQYKASRNVHKEESDYETINQVVHRFGLTDSIPSTGFLSSKSGSQGRRRTPGPKAPESWQDLDTMQSTENLPPDLSKSLAQYGNGRRWSRQRRVDVYALWAENTLVHSLELDQGILPTGLRRDSDKTGVQSMTSYCLSVMGSHLDRTRGDERSWMTSNDGKVALGKRLRGPLMVHAAVDGQSSWQGFLDLFDHTSGSSRHGASAPEHEDASRDWDASSSDEDEGPVHGPKAPAMQMLDFSFVPLPSSARCRIQDLLKDPLALSNLTSISFAGSGLALGDVVDILCQKESTDEEEIRTRSRGTLRLRLTDLSLAGLGARDETEARNALETLRDAFQQLLFLDLSYTRTFPAYDGLQMLDTLYTLPERGGERLRNLDMLGFRHVISKEQLEKEASGAAYYGKPVIRRRSDVYVLKESTAKVVLLNYRRQRAGKCLQVILERKFHSSWITRLSR